MATQLSASKRRRVQYDPQSMAKVIEAVRGGMPKKSAARLYAVPHSSLHDKVVGRVPDVPTKPGKCPTLTSAEESTLVTYVNLMCEIGYPLTSVEFRKHKDVYNTDSEEENEIPFMDDNADDFSEDFDIYPKCKQLSGSPTDWINCDICMVGWHIKCADRPEFLLLDEERRKDAEFICSDCF